jgi:serralysin
MKVANVGNLCIAYNCTIENAVGGSGNDTLIGNSSNNNFKGGTGNDSIDGSDGIDTASYSGVRAAYKLIKSATSLQVSSTLEGNDTLANIERLQFTNVVIALDINANAGQAYRIYQAAFNRTPDNAGLKYWIGIMDSGVSLSTVSSAFIASAEFQKLYGPNPSNAQFVTKLYDNVLNRAPDTGGYNYWVGLLNTGGIDKISTLVNFSESNENQAGVIGVIQNGIELFN